MPAGAVWREWWAGLGRALIWSETYKARAGENLASAQYLLLRWFIGVLVVCEVEAWRAACVLALLQRRCVSFIHALQGATTHTPVEIVHALPLQVNRDNSSEVQEKDLYQILQKKEHMHIVLPFHKKKKDC